MAGLLSQGAGAVSELIGIPADWVVQGGAVGLLGIGVVMVLTGRLIPVSVYRALERDRDHWREVAMKAVGQNDDLITGARIASEVTQALTQATKTAHEEE